MEAVRQFVIHHWYCRRQENKIVGQFIINNQKKGDDIFKLTLVGLLLICGRSVLGWFLGLCGVLSVKGAGRVLRAGFVVFWVLFGACSSGELLVGESFSYELSKYLPHLLQGRFSHQILPVGEFADVSGEVFGAHVVAGCRGSLV